MHSVFEILEEATDSAGPDLISLDDLKLALGVTDDGEDAALQAMITTAAGYHFDPASGRLWTDGYWADTLAVTYSGGYDLPEEAPARLQKAIILSVNEGRTSGTRDPSIQSVQHGDTRISYFTNATSSASPGFLSAPVIDLIRPYRRLYVA
jgi:hypothetical protein